MINGHGGNIFALAARNGCQPRDIMDFSSNINPLGTMPQLIPYLNSCLKQIAVLPEVDNRALVEQFSAHHQIPADTVLAGGGTTQFIYALPKALALRNPLIVAPTYADYADACLRHGVVPTYHYTTPENNFLLDLKALDRAVDGHDAVFICNPNNPTGRLTIGEELRDLCVRHKTVYFIIDESYLPFVPQATRHSLLAQGLSNVIVLHSLSKIFGIPGLRIGYVIAARPLIDRLNTSILPWSVNILAQAAARFIFLHQAHARDYIETTRSFLAAERPRLAFRLALWSDVVCFPSATSFILVRLPQGITADDIWERLAADRILIRNCSNFKGLNNNYIRIALKNATANTHLSERFGKAFSDLRHRCGQ